MTNLEKLESVIQEMRKLSNEQRVAFLSYLTGGLKSYLISNKVNDKHVLQAYIDALEFVKNELN